jgi:glycosyltransferase involved in cell wall biosynthesis
MIPHIDNKKLSGLPLVSVLIPAHNAEQWLATAVESVLAQTYGAIEVLVIENGSDDRTLAVAESYRSDAVTVLSRRDGHIVAALNEGIRVSHGVYIARQDADDWSASDRIEKQVALLEAKESVLVCGCGYREIAPDGTPARQRRVYLEPPSIRTRLQTGMPFAGGSLVAQRTVVEALGGFDPFFDGLVGEDYDFLVRTAEITDIAAVDECLYFRRVGNPDSMCGRIGRDYRSTFALVRDRAEHRGSNFFGSTAE